ncbi:MAG: molybdopterin-dependent oxidoreductase [Gemmatirosa sp.]|nr:molybdopterin-dependent oxidoreductase [Gemmatirosa sp.]
MSRDLTRAAARLVDGTVARLEARGAIDRRRFLAQGTASLAALLAGGALAACDSQGPASAQRLLRFAERRNEGVERWLMRHTAMDHARASAVNAGGHFPSYHVAKIAPTWDATARGPWSLEIAGLVQRPQRFTLDQLVHLPQTQQRVNHYCVEGWNAVATFWGVRMREIARLAGPLPQAQYVDFESFDHDPQSNVDFHECWDLESALHPQTLVVYAKDGEYLNAAYGAPARVHSPVKLGYKNAKYLTRIVFRAERNGGYWSDMGYEWYGGT